MPRLWPVLLLLAGCQVIPDEGPSTASILKSGSPAKETRLPFVVIDLDGAVANRLNQAQDDAATALASADTTLPPGRHVGGIGVGDLLHVTLWQANPSGDTLLTPAAVELNTRVDTDGTVSVPFAGRVRVAGLRPAMAERDVVARLEGQTLAPQASVLVSDDETNGVLVGGEVARPGRVSLAAGADRLSDVLALAGGARRPTYQIAVTVQRGDAILHIGLSRLMADPARDIELAPGDRVVLSPVDEHFFAFGAVNRPGTQSYTADRMTLADGIGAIAGLQDGRANPAGLFVFRHQAAAVTRSLLHQPPDPDTDLTQVVYRLDLRDPMAFFVMSRAPLVPGDIVYVSNAPLAELGKFASIVAGVSSVAATPRNFGAY